MKRLLALLLLPAVAVPAGVAAQSQAVAFVHVNVLPMDRERVLEDHTVIVRDGTIQEMAPSHRVSIPGEARVIDGTGLFLLPGLADMHVSLPSPQATRDQVRDFMFLCLANNITVVRGARGYPNHLQMKREVREGSLLGPTVYVGSPPLPSGVLQDPEAAVAQMLSHRSAGYDFQITGTAIPLTTWDSLTEEAHSRGYSFGGEIPDSVGLRHALSTGISAVDHMDGYLEEVVSDAVKNRLEGGERVPLEALLASVEGRKMRAMAAHTRASDTWVVPTLYRWENRYRPLNADSLAALPEMRYLPPSVVDGWILQAEARPEVPEETASQLVETRRRLLRALVMAGVGVLLGTDSPEMFNVPGFSLRHELESMAAAGLTPYEILVTGTRDVAEYARRELREPGNFGTVTEGNRADLLLLRNNPFHDLNALWDQEGVMVRGRWIPRAELDAGLQDLADRFGG